MRAAASAMRLLGSGNPPLHRFRVGLEFALSGHREVDGMIEHHAGLARTLAEELGLPDGGARGGRCRIRAVGRARLARRAQGRRTSRIAARLAQLAEFVEVAHRVGGVDAARTLARKRAGKQFDPELAALVDDEAEMILDGSGRRSEPGKR